ncbi:hypothetical protein [Ancylomarina sp. 16SWW S1-10-2]|uniref:hypothetical protein n=1 Tax=Ancylomarina sp. 16SWW S1-10-2 TaxID=2499681 RepID=UPI0012AD5442|nr:hypothetical protein [Ancylomarina sp. 16SWW S1-10-2]MRT93788.1 hypothetical protein [Ancylomarina sp. 16SWW S1-10-2]
MKTSNNKFILIFIVLASMMCSCTNAESKKESLNIPAYLKAGDSKHIYPTVEQIEMLKKVVPETAFQPAPQASDRAYWDKIANGEEGKVYLEEAVSLLKRKPEVPISDAIYRRANKEGNRKIYKPRYYRTMDRLEKFIIAECIENKGRFIPQVEVYCDSIMAMKSWMHPNHDDRENSVLEGKRVAIDLGARKFGLVLALANALLVDKLPESLRSEITTQLQWRITDSYLKTCKGEDKVGNSWVKSTSNWNSVCTSGTIFSTIVASKNSNERIVAIGCALNSMVYYLSGFGADGYCSEGTGYWNYGFGHYLYLAEILEDYTDGKINLFEFNDPEKLKNVANFPHNFQIHEGMYAPFADGVTRVKSGNDNFAYIMASKHYGAQKQVQFVPDEGVQTLVIWNDGQDYTYSTQTSSKLPEYTYFDDFGILISRGQQQVPFSIAIKAGHNAENHNHSDVGTYVLVLGEDYISGDIGAPSYTAGAFSKNNPARSSWGHPVPRINKSLQSNGIEFKGKILQTSFNKEADNLVMDIKPAYEISGLEKLERSVVNDKTGKGCITITDNFEASESVSFGTAIMVNVDYKIVGDNTIIINSENQKVKVEISSVGGKVIIKDEVVPIKHLRSGKTSYRIGVDFEKPLQKGSISVKYIPVTED